MKRLLISVGFGLSALVHGAGVPTPVPLAEAEPRVLSATLLDGKLCHLPPALIVNYTDGTMKLITVTELLSGLRAELEELPIDHVQTVHIPCTGLAAPTGTDGPMHPTGARPTACQVAVEAVWRRRSQGAADTFCAQI